MKFTKLESTGGGNFLKLADGESVVGIPAGEIHSFKQEWVNGKANVVNEPNPAKHNRFEMNFIVKGEDGKPVAKVWGYGVTIYSTLAEFAAEMNIISTKIKVTRKGTGTDTTYVLIPLGKVETAPEVKLNILNKGSKAPIVGPAADNWEPGPEPQFSDAMDEDQIPF